LVLGTEDNVNNKQNCDGWKEIYPISTIWVKQKMGMWTGLKLKDSNKHNNLPFQELLLRVSSPASHEVKHQ